MKTVTTLEDNDVKEAVAAWMTIKLNRVITTENVKLSTTTKTVGHALNESTIHIPSVRIEE